MHAKLESATRRGDLGEMSRLLVDARSQAPAPKPSEPELISLLAVAVQSRQTKAVDFLLRRGASPDAGESQALKAAVEAEDAEMLRHLVEKGAKIDPPPSRAGTKAFESALGLAVRRGRHEMARLLIEMGADVNYPQSRPMIANAALNGDLRMLDLLIEHGARVDQVGSFDHRTALMFVASQAGSLGGLPSNASAVEALGRSDAKWVAVARRLVSAGADVNYINRACQTAYQEALVRHSEAFINALAELGADPASAQRCQARRRRASGPDEELRVRDELATRTRRLLETDDYAELEALYLEP